MKINVKKPPSFSVSSESSQPIIPSEGRGQMFVYLGPPGSGKTSYIAEHPNPRFIIEEKETGILDLMDAGLVPKCEVEVLKDWSSLIRYNDDLLQLPSPQKAITLAYESLTGFEQESHRHCCALRYNNNWDSTRKGFMFYQEGFKVAAKEFFSQLVLQHCRLREKGYNIAFSGHTQKITEKNIDDLDFMAAAGACQVPTMEVISPYYQNIFFIDQDVDAKKETEHAKGKIVSYEKKMFVKWSPWRKAAKNRYGIQDDLTVDRMSPREMYETFCRVAKLDPKTLRHLGRKV